MNARLAKKVLLSVAVSAATLSALAACDLGLTPYVAPVDGGTAIPIDTGAPPDPVVDAGSNDAGKDAGDAGPAVKRVFVTSAKTRGNIGGQIGGDTLCQSLATTAKLGGGPFVAWLSETGKPAIDRITDVGPWFLVDRRTQVFANKVAITTMGPATPIDTDEKGTQLGNGIFTDTLVWTGTLPSGGVAGQAVSNTCNEWTNQNPGPMGQDGTYDKRNAEWTTSGPQEPCDSQLRIYCFEQ